MILHWPCIVFDILHIGLAELGGRIVSDLLIVILLLWIALTIMPTPKIPRRIRQMLQKVHERWKSRLKRGFRRLEGVVYP